MTANKKTAKTVGGYRVWLRKDGRYEGRVPGVGKDGRPKQLVRYGRTPDEVRAALDKLVADLKEGREVEGRPRTVAELVDTYLESTDWAAKRANSKSSTGSHLRRLRAGLGRRRVPDVSVETVEDWLDALRNKDGSLPSRATLKQAQATVSGLWRWAIHKRTFGARENVARGPRSGGPSVGKDRADTADIHPFEPSEIPPLLAALRSMPEGLIYELVLSTGLRPEEVRALRAEDVTVAEGYAVVRVRQSVCRPPGGGFLVEERLKSKASKRDVYFHPGTLGPRLAERVGAMGGRAAEAEAAGRVWDGRFDDLVFLDDNGRPLAADKYRAAWYSILEATGLERRIPYQLRHTYASHRALRGDPLFDISRDLGHGSVQVTAKVYAHQFTEAKMKHAVRPLYEEPAA